MSERDWRDLDRRLDDVIDALNDERAPEPALDDDDAELIETLRMVRRLRPPTDPEERFAELLIERTLAGLEPSSLTAFPNGAVEPLPFDLPTAVLSRRRRLRIVLAQIAALLRVVGVFVLAGFLAGAFVGGLGGRLAMRASGYLFLRENPGAVVITEASEQPVGQISLSGTIDLMFNVAFSSTLIGLLLLVVAPWLPTSRRNRTIVFGVLVLAVFGPSVINAGDRDLRSLGPPVLNVAMFAAVVVAVGIATPAVAGWLERATSMPRHGWRRMGTEALRGLTVGFGALGLIACFFLLVFVGAVHPILELVNPNWRSIGTIPLAVTMALLIPLARIAAALPVHSPRLDSLRSERGSALIVNLLRLAIVAGLLATSISAVQLAT
jgi:hypothetical protein